MASNDDSFWADIFRKYPVIATFMAVGGIIGCGIGIYYFGDGRIGHLRAILCLIFSISLGGIAVGLVSGVIVDSFIGVFRSDEKKKRKGKPRARDLRE
jgi:hypothetical protein